MNKILNPFVILSTLIVVTTVSATKYVENEGILILGYNELNQAIKEFDHILIAFFSPWCGLFRSPPFEYKEAAAFLRRDRSSTVKFAKIDVSKHQKSWEQYNLRECPTLKFFMKGEEISYDGGRSSYEISNWIRRQLRSTTIELESFQHLSKLQWWKEVIVIFLGGKDHKYWPAFWKASRKLDQDDYDVTFAYTSKADIISELKVPEGTRLVLLKKFDELRNELAGGFDAVSLLKFIEENRHPLVPTFDQNAAQRTFKECIPTIFLLHGDNKADLKAKKTFYEAAQQLKGKIHFAYSNPYDGGLGPRLAEYLEVGKREIPLVILVVPLRSLAKKLYRFERELTTENLIKFYDDYKAGTLTRWLKSEAIPKINDKPVKVKVAYMVNLLKLIKRLLLGRPSAISSLTPPKMFSLYFIFRGIIGGKR